jgi:hypothetical protein
VRTLLTVCVVRQVQAHVEDAVAKGAVVTVGGCRPDLPEPYNKVPWAACLFFQTCPPIVGPQIPRQKLFKPASVRV